MDDGMEILYVGKNLDLDRVREGNLIRDIKNGTIELITMVCRRDVKTIFRKGNGGYIFRGRRNLNHYNSEKGVWGSSVGIYWKGTDRYELADKRLREVGL